MHVQKKGKAGHMNNSEPLDTNGKLTQSDTPHIMRALSEAFLTRLINELDDEFVTAIMLHGSYARGEAIPPYSDVDLVRVIRENASSTTPKKRYVWREEYLISISSRPISVYREWFATPERAIFVVPGVQEARILLDKDGAFSALQQEAKVFQWMPLQSAANSYASQLLLEQTEIALKSLRALSLQDVVALSDMTLDLFSAVTEAIAVQRGVFIVSGNTYFHQVQEAVGQNSLWTYYHRLAAGTASNSEFNFSMKERGIAALRLYQETARLLQPFVSSDGWEVIEEVLKVIEHALADKQIG
jgi:predicted nucleotidyltransferase